MTEVLDTKTLHDREYGGSKLRGIAERILALALVPSAPLVGIGEDVTSANSQRNVNEIHHNLPTQRRELAQETLKMDTREGSKLEFSTVLGLTEDEIRKLTIDAYWEARSYDDFMKVPEIFLENHNLVQGWDSDDERGDDRDDDKDDAYTPTAVQWLEDEFSGARVGGNNDIASISHLLKTKDMLSSAEESVVGWVLSPESAYLITRSHSEMVSIYILSSTPRGQQGVYDPTTGGTFSENFNPAPDEPDTDTQKVRVAEVPLSSLHSESCFEGGDPSMVCENRYHGYEVDVSVLGDEHSGLVFSVFSSGEVKVRTKKPSPVAKIVNEGSMERARNSFLRTYPTSVDIRDEPTERVLDKVIPRDLYDLVAINNLRRLTMVDKPLWVRKPESLGRVSVRSVRFDTGEMPATSSGEEVAA